MSSLKTRLVTQNSDLRNLKFGADRPFKGSSGQPFVREPLPGVLEDNPNLGLLGGNTDFILRAGTLKRSADDVSRLGKFLLGTGQGAAFIAKQNLLSLSNVKTGGTGINQGIYLPTSTLAQVGVAGVGGHLLKQGINPFRDTSFPSGGQSSDPNLFQRILNTVNDVTGLPVYSSFQEDIKNKNTNRLVSLKEEKLGKQNRSVSFEVGPLTIGGDFSFSGGGEGPSLETLIESGGTNPSILNNSNSLNFISTDPTKLLQYNGGPGSILGVGKTTIKRATYSNEGLDFSKNPEFAKYNIASYNSKTLASQKSTEMDPSIRADFRLKTTKGPNANSIISDSLDYADGLGRNIEERVSLGNPGKKGNRKSYVKGKLDAQNKEIIADKINALQIYQSAYVTQNEVKNDLADFRISVIDPNKVIRVDPDSEKQNDHYYEFAKTFLHFRAFIDNFQDNMSAEWNAQKYMGRGENFYRYNGFDRSIDLSFTVAAQSKGELMPMYHKLNYLQSAMAPNYTPGGYFFGNLVKMKVGGYLYEVPGIITSLNYTIPQESPWEIAISDTDNVTEDGIPTFTDATTQVMPHMIKVSLQFKPIHKFAPRLQQNRYGIVNQSSGTGGVVEKFGKEHFISLGRGEGVNYTGYNKVSGINPTTGESAIEKISEITPAGVAPPPTPESLITTEGLLR